MPYRDFAPLKQAWCRTLLIAMLPLACAVGVKPEFEDDGDDTATSGGAGSAGHGSGGTLPFAGSFSTAGLSAKSGSSGSGGSVASPFGGTSSTAGHSSGGAGGAAGAAGNGRGGGAGGEGGGASGAGGAGTGTCACPKKITWTDDTNVSFGPGDCLLVDTKLYLYTGAKAQTWANKDCNPTMQLAWCSDIGADYKFMLCK